MQLDLQTGFSEIDGLIGGQEKLCEPYNGTVNITFCRTTTQDAISGNPD